MRHLQQKLSNIFTLYKLNWMFFLLFVGCQLLYETVSCPYGKACLWMHSLHCVWTPCTKGRVKVPFIHPLWIPDSLYRAVPAATSLQNLAYCGFQILNLCSSNICKKTIIAVNLNKNQEALSSLTRVRKSWICLNLGAGVCQPHNNWTQHTMPTWLVNWST